MKNYKRGIDIRGEKDGEDIGDAIDFLDNITLARGREELECVEKKGVGIFSRSIIFTSRCLMNLSSSNSS